MIQGSKEELAVTTPPGLDYLQCANENYFDLHVCFGHCRYLFKVVVSSANVSVTTGNALDVLYNKLSQF